MINTIIIGLLIFFLVVLIVAIIAFWIWMLIDSLQRTYKHDSDKIAWVLVLIFTGIIGAIIYYFVIKKK